MSRQGLAPTRYEVVIVVVLYNPDEESIAHIRCQAGYGYNIMAVSNGCTDAQRNELSAMSGVELIENFENAGLARALNQGLERFLLTAMPYVLLLDQDSRVSSDMIDLLRHRAVRLHEAQVALGCVAPRLVDQKEVAATVGAPGEPLTVATSGSLLTRKAVLEVGPMWEELFIDGIDHEWCFRARAKGFSIVVERDATLAHNMGDAGVRIGSRFRPLHRSPFRHYHILRNTLWLQKCRYIPMRWRLKELVKTFYRVPTYFFVSNDRVSTLRSILRATVDGIFRPPLPPAIRS